MSDDDNELAKMLGAQQAAAQQMSSAMHDLATLLGMFRAQLIIAGFASEDATAMTHDYFNALLDSGLARSSGSE